MSKTDYAKDCCSAEIMAAFISRNLKGVNVAGIGAASQIPWMGIRLAQATHSPDLWFFWGPGSAMNSKFNKMEFGVDHRMTLGAESHMNMAIGLDLFANPRFTSWVLFFGGFQIDKYGNVNMAYIGDQKKPKFRGPGTLGLMNLAFRAKIFLFTGIHNPRLFVEKVDFISGPGYLDGPGAREKVGCLPDGGPRFVITPIGIFDFDEETKIMRLKSVHPGHTVKEVLEKTGFTPIVPKDVPETEPPTGEEVAFMRSFDPEGILPKLTA
jgi:glutaconate CoA-transferase subunit B